MIWMIPEVELGVEEMGFIFFLNSFLWNNPSSDKALFVLPLSRSFACLSDFKSVCIMVALPPSNIVCYATVAFPGHIEVMFP